MANTHLTEEQLALINKKLALKQRELEEELARFAKKNPDIKGDWQARYEDIGTEWDDSAHEVTEYDKNVSLEQSLELHLKSVREALARLKEGTYGICTKDSKPIGAERLLAYPETTVCRDHVTEQ